MTRLHRTQIVDTNLDLMWHLVRFVLRNLSIRLHSQIDEVHLQVVFPRVQRTAEVFLVDLNEGRHLLLVGTDATFHSR